MILLLHFLILYRIVFKFWKIIDSYKSIKMRQMSQYDLPQKTLTLAGFWQWKHTSPSLIGSCSNGTHNVFAAPVKEFSSPKSPYLVSIPDLSLTFYSHSLYSHHGVKTTFFLFNSVMNSSQLMACFFLSLSLFNAFWYIFSWIFSKSSDKLWTKLFIDNWIFSPLYLNTHLTSFFSISFGPSSSLTGTPFNYQWLYFQPGL